MNTFNFFDSSLFVTRDWIVDIGIEKEGEKTIETK